jgi:hypothetical protein
MGVGVAQSVQRLDYKLDNRMTGVQSLAEAKDLSSSLFAQTGSEAD